MYAGLFGTTSKFGWLFFGIKIFAHFDLKTQKNIQNVVRHHFCVHNHV
jgi:hypothetical protein